jgi:hypothetical protein
VILEYEAGREKELIEKLQDVQYQPNDSTEEMDVDGTDTRNEPNDIYVAISETLAKGAAVPTQQEIERILVQRRRQQVSVEWLCIYSSARSANCSTSCSTDMFRRI